MSRFAMLFIVYLIKRHREEKEPRGLDGVAHLLLATDVDQSEVVPTGAGLPALAFLPGA